MIKHYLFSDWKKAKAIFLILAIGFSCNNFLTTLTAQGLNNAVAIGAYLDGNLPATSTATPPQFLSQTGAFSNLTNLTPNPGVIPYDMIEPFWSDGASKSRWMAIPNNGSHNAPSERIQFSADGNWVFPIGAVLIKHFELGGQRLETRFEVRASNGDYYYLTYKWNSNGTDAELLTTGLDETVVVNGQVQVWHYPSPTECLDCHSPEVENVLGPKTRYLNKDITYPTTGITANQLVTLSAIGILNQNITNTNVSNYTAIAAHDDTDFSLEYRARSYIDVNCSYCHQPATENRGEFDARITTPLAQQNLINGPVEVDLGLNDPRVITPQDLGESMLHFRMNSLQAGTQMPPLATNVIHEEGVQLIADWINSLPLTPDENLVASFTASPIVGNAPLNVSFDASGSSTNSGNNLTYAWNFGDGNTASGVSPNHIYTTPGSYAYFLVRTSVVFLCLWLT